MRKITIAAGKLAVLCLSLVLISPSNPAFAEEPVEQAAELETTAADSFSYNPAGRRDPFVPLVNQIKKTSRVPVTKPRGPLQMHELTQFRLMAVLVISGKPMAMVTAPDGKSYTVKVGDEIGRYAGKVKKIETKVTKRDESGKRVEVSPDRIVVEEVVQDNFSGQKSVELRYLTM